MRIGSLLLLPFLSAVAVACGSSHTSQPAQEATPEAGPDDAAAAVDAPTPVDAGPDRYAAFVPAVPTVLDSGGPVLKTARVVPVFFPNDANQASATDFVTKYLASPEWKTSVAEYGVTGAVVAPAIVAPALPMFLASSGDFEAWLKSQLDGTNPVWGATDDQTLASTLFLFFAPAGPLAAPDSTYTLCQEAYGWHTHTTPASVSSLDGGAPGAEAGTLDAGAAGPNVPVLYGIVGECPPQYGVSTLDQLTQTASHELAEAFTDPFWDTNPARFLISEPYRYWVSMLGGSEIGDLCNAFPNDSFTPAALGYSVQRLWSNQAALAGQDPCQPVPPGAPPYFNAVPDTPDTFMDPNFGVMVRGVNVQGGVPRTIDVHLFSDGPTSDWTVQALAPGYTSPLGLKLDRTKGNNGDVLHLTITVNSSKLAGETLPFAIVSGDTTQAMWIDEVLVTP